MQTWANDVPLPRSPSLSGSDDFNRRVPSSQASGTPNSSTSWEVVSAPEFEMPPLANQSLDDPNSWLGDSARDATVSMHGETATNGSCVSVFDPAFFLLEAEAAQPCSPTDSCSASVAGAAIDEAISVHLATAKASGSDGPLSSSSEAMGQNHLANVFRCCQEQGPPDGHADASCTAYASKTPSITGHHAMLGVAAAATVEITSLRAFLGEEVPAFPFAVSALQHACCGSSAEPLVA